MARTSEEIESALSHLDEADQEFVIRFVLASGSLKDVAAGYGVSYPTIRSRLDRVISRLAELRRGQPVSPLRELLAKLVEKGELGATAARRILEEHRKEIEHI
jgi:hypothetical protein